MVGTMINATVIIKFAISPTPPVDEPTKKRKTSFISDAVMPETGPNTKPASKINTSEKSSFRKGAAGKIGNSKNETTNAIAENIPVPAIILVVLFCIRKSPFP